jgi:hypothetical protein
MKVALVSIAKDEDIYIEEWITYHKKIGFDKIFIYENDWRCTCEDQQLVKIPFDGKTKQIPAYNHFIKTYYLEYDWVLFLDVDEFLVIKNYNNIKDFIAENYLMGHGFGINWALFGNNGHSEIRNNSYSVLERFTKRGANVFPMYKTLLRLSSNRIRMINPHKSNVVIRDTENNIIKGNSHTNGSYNKLQINHYFCKTQQEYLNKIERGSADATPKRTLDSWHAHNMNEVEDDEALKFYRNAVLPTK